jgi:methionyl-tRNA synthetase
MPVISQTIQKQLNAPVECNVLTDQFVCFLPEGHKIGKPSPLFQKIEPSLAAELREKYCGQPHPKAATKTTDPKEIERLTAEVATQGDIVRKLKAAKAEKSQIDTEVNKLLDLKKQLAAVQGEPAQPAGSGGKKNKKKGGATPKGTPNPPTSVSESANSTIAQNGPSAGDVMELNAKVLRQGDVVRQLKMKKGDQAQINEEVAKLMELKKALAIAQGQDPEQLVGGGKKAKGKKK